MVHVGNGQIPAIPGDAKKDIRGICSNINCLKEIRVLPIPDSDAAVNRRLNEIARIWAAAHGGDVRGVGGFSSNLGASLGFKYFDSVGSKRGAVNQGASK